MLKYNVQYGTYCLLAIIYYLELSVSYIPVAVSDAKPTVKKIKLRLQNVVKSTAERHRQKCSNPTYNFPAIISNCIKIDTMVPKSTNDIVCKVFKS